MEKKSAKRGGTLVYRPLGVSKRRLNGQISNRSGTCNYSVTCKHYKEGRRVSYVFDSINYRIFFDENNWDTNKERNLDKYAKIKKKSRFFKKKWMPDTTVYVKGSLERKKRKFVVYLADILMKLLLTDIAEKDNKIIFSVYSASGHVKGWYKIGVFKNYGLLYNFENIIFSIVPHKEEMIGEYYPVLKAGIYGNKILNKVWSEKKIEHEDINIQERLAAHNRLSGLYRRICKLAKNKKANLQVSYRLSRRHLNDNKDSSSC